jgi:hypothetical protein
MKTPSKRCTSAALALASALAAVASPIAQAEPEHRAAPQSCFYASNIENYAVANDRLVYLRVGVADVYRLDLMTDCPELTFRQNIAITHTGASDLVCSPIDLTIRFRQIAARRVCPVGDMRKLTAAEVAALPKHDRP